MQDVGWNDVSYNSDQTQIHTPNLDKLSAEGVRFKQHYVHSVCTPSRAALLTGRYGSNVGLFYTIMPGSPTGLPTDVLTLPQLLREEGYRTAMVGKWHLGNSQVLHCIPISSYEGIWFSLIADYLITELFIVYVVGPDS